MSNNSVSKNIIERPSWNSKDLYRICAYLNTNGGILKYNIKEKEEENTDSVEKTLNLINNKLKKIGPNINGLIEVLSEEEDGQKHIRINVKTSPIACYVISRSGEKTYYYIENGNVVKTSEETIKRSKQNLTNSRKSITKLTSNMIIPDTKCIESSFKFANGHTVPIYEAYSVYGFNRIVGYLKYLNRTYANVYSRGQCELYDSLIPSLYRNKPDLRIEDKKIDVIVNRILNDNKLLDSLNLDVVDKERSRYRIEGVLQHYGATTSFLDVVDNHWVALWMGLNDYTTTDQIEKYAKYVERTIPIIDKIGGNAELIDEKDWEKKIYQYVLLIAVPYSINPTVDGINITNDIVEIDLRKSLPSTFLRPHAQHGLVIKKNVQSHIKKSEDFDLSNNVVAIIRIRIDRAKKWIGDGELLTQDNLIPPPGYDPGYDLLLSKYQIFRKSALKITKYM